MHPIILITH